MKAKTYRLIEINWIAMPNGRGDFGYDTVAVEIPGGIPRELTRKELYREFGRKQAGNLLHAGSIPIYDGKCNVKSRLRIMSEDCPTYYKNRLWWKIRHRKGDIKERICG